MIVLPLYIKGDLNSPASEEIGHGRHETDQQAAWRGGLFERRILVVYEGDVESWEGEKGVDED